MFNLVIYWWLHVRQKCVNQPFNLDHWLAQHKHVVFFFVRCISFWVLSFQIWPLDDFNSQKSIKFCLFFFPPKIVECVVNDANHMILNKILCSQNIIQLVPMLPIWFVIVVLPCIIDYLESCDADARNLCEDQVQFSTIASHTNIIN